MVAPDAAAGPPRFTLYSRSYCHLCEDMLAALQAMAPAGAPFDVDVVDIDSDAGPSLLARFDELVPVLFGDDPHGAALCHYVLDEAAVAGWLARRAP
ncbi:glutaredoxin family protein [Massilia sp. DWR3-1-1]|uniref:glutaredoxin family protein n=1 Tax=Massilia sp. DWR3-1-1 TaxID=2804559 RepID=UPI003CE8BC41